MTRGFDNWTSADIDRIRSSGTATVAQEPKPTKADIKRESELQSLCELELNRRGIAFLHLSPKAREKKGWPDLVFCFRTSAGEPWPCAVELKGPVGVLSNDQIDVLTRMRENVWHTYVIRDMTTFVDLLNGHKPEEWRKDGT